jgi:hypothetical protein
MEPRKLSAFFPHVEVDVPMDVAWPTMVDYMSWNPAFANARVTTVAGTPGAEGEVIHIEQYDAEGSLTQVFRAETVRIVPRHHITWAVFPEEGDDYLNFGDFELLERPGGVEFYIQYFAQTRTANADLAEVRAGLESGLRELVLAFKAYCESHAG